MEKLREDKFTPYRPGCGPEFTLVLWDANGRMSTGQRRLGYELRMDGQVLFKGEDYGCSPMHAIDSDKAVEALMSFMCLPKGGTDAEYFDRYTQAQLAFRDEHAEALYCEVLAALKLSDV